MDSKTLTALKASIEHWTKNSNVRKSGNASTSNTTCALCDLYNNGRGTCKGCPVQKITGLPHCQHTPWSTAFVAINHWDRKPTPKNAALFRKAAKTELDFLKSLLPEQPNDK